MTIRAIDSNLGRVGMQAARDGNESKPLRGFPRQRLPIIFWAVFAMGMLAQVFSPHLKIENHAFSMPSDLLPPGTTISPSDIVAKERIIQATSAILTVGGALGLARCYWQRLFHGARSEPSAASGSSQEG